MTAQHASEPGQQGASVHVIGGRPDDLEVAALVAGLAAVASGSVQEPEAPEVPNQWQDRSRRLGQPLPPGPDRWRWSTR